MKSMIVVLTVAILALAPGIATADDEEDVIAAVLDYISGWNNGDAAKIAQYMLPDATSFTQGTGLAAAPFNQTALQNNMNNGADFNLFFRNMKVQVYGDTAVFTAYEVGNITFQQGQVNQGPWRYTAVLVKQDGVWKQAHRHASPLRTGEHQGNSSSWCHEGGARGSTRDLLALGSETRSVRPSLTSRAG